MEKILLIIPGIGNPNFELKEKILYNNIKILEDTTDKKIDIKVFNYSNNVFSSDLEIIKEPNIIGQYLYNDLPPSVIDPYEYVVILLDDIEIVKGFNLDNIIHILKELSLDIISPSLTFNSEYSWGFMLERNEYKDKLRIVNFCECFCYIMTKDAYNKYYNILDNETYWLWGIDMILYNLGFKLGIYNEYKIHHHFKSASYRKDLPNPFYEMENKFKKYPKISSQHNLNFIEII
jgi:hypothetical protein